MLNNALRFIRDGQTEEACEEIIFAIEKADGYFHEDIISFVKEVRGRSMQFCTQCGARIALDSVLPVEQKKLKYSGESICINCQTKECDGCLLEPMEGVMNE